MAYFKINGVDFSHIVNELHVGRSANYNAQTNAAGNTVVDYINTKRTIEVGIIPLDDSAMAELLGAVDGFSVELSYRDPISNVLEEGVACIVPEAEVDYYTIQSGKVMYNAFTLEFTEL